MVLLPPLPPFRSCAVASGVQRLLSALSANVPQRLSNAEVRSDVQICK